MCIISNKPRSLTSTDVHAGNCKAIDYAMEIVSIGKKLGTLFVICQICQTFTSFTTKGFTTQHYIYNRVHKK